jgi:ABC-type sugar transport system ATPase subunit
MPIGNVIQSDSTIRVYNEKGHEIFSKFFGSGPKNGLKGYTGSTVSIQQGNTITTYNEKGHEVGRKFA